MSQMQMSTKATTVKKPYTGFNRWMITTMAAFIMRAIVDSVRMNVMLSDWLGFPISLAQSCSCIAQSTAQPDEGRSARSGQGNAE